MKHSRMKILLLLIIIFIHAVSLNISSVQAQDNLEDQDSLIDSRDIENDQNLILEPSSEIEVTDLKKLPEEKDSRIFNKDRNTQKISELKILYRDQIESYRNSDKKFTVAKTHYFNVETLIALEEVVSATSTAMTDRTKVMITYLELIGATLEDTSGVELSLKTQSLKQINTMIATLYIHQEDIVLAKDRTSVNLLSDNFEVFVEQYNQIAYKALSLIRIGQIQAVYDVSELIDLDIKEAQQKDDISVVAASKRKRAYQEIERNFTAINTGLADLNSNINQGDTDTFSRSFYERILQDLEPIYIQISKSLDHLEELLKL